MKPRLKREPEVTRIFCVGAGKTYQVEFIHNPNSTKRKHYATLSAPDELGALLEFRKWYREKWPKRVP
jgi:hypothetical protein